MENGENIMTILIDTSEYDRARFALIQESGVVASLDKTFTHSEGYKLLKELQNFLRKSKVSIENLSKVIICTGPGSFTGLRVGLALVKGLTFGKQIPLLGIEKKKIPNNLAALLKMKLHTKLELKYDKPSYINE